MSIALSLTHQIRTVMLTSRRLKYPIAYLVSVLLLTTCLTRPAFSQVVEASNAASFTNAQPASIQANRVERVVDARLTPPILLGRRASQFIESADWTQGTRMFASQQKGSSGGRPATWWAPAASVLLPGSGQALLRQQRSLAYLLAEAFMLIQAQRAKTDLEEARARYRNIAADVARLQFGAERPVGTWDYYEIMAKADWASSGNYDLAIGGKFTPETDETTYNGKQWLLARRLYWDSPIQAPVENSAEYQNALEFYRNAAIQPNFRWTWRDNQNAKELYVQTIKEANHSKQQRVSMLGLIAANHLLSLVDAYISVRLRRYGGAGLVGASIETELRPIGVPGENLMAAGMKVSLPIPGSGGRP